MSRKVLTLSERVEAIKLHDGGKSSRDVAQIMGVGRTQIQQIIKRKSEVLDNYESNVSNDRKRKRHILVLSTLLVYKNCRGSLYIIYIHVYTVKPVSCDLPRKY